ncbi:MAG: hypothetical protein IJ838_01570 [Paludibacteraceae bacterium]|nr:hypothetical protein [Paludibacteraceae bacterium]
MKTPSVLLCLFAIMCLWSCRSATYDAALMGRITAETEAFRNGKVPTDSTLVALVTAARNTDDSQALCHALYLQGSVYHYLCRYDLAMTALKEAETLIPSLSNDDPIAGMIYTVQGSTLEQNDYLWTEADKKYEAALPYFEQCGDTMRLATTYRDIARMSLWREDTARYEQCFQEAICLAGQQHNRLIYHDIRMQYLLNHYPPDTLTMMCENQILCDSFHLFRYAWIPVEHFLSQDRTDSARYWLQQFAADTALTRWSREHYAYLESLLLAQEGQTDSAFTSFLLLYNQSVHRLQAEGMSRTYAIARQYDLEKAEKRALQLQVDKLRLYIVLGAVALLLLGSLLVAFMERNKRLKREKEVEISRLQTREANRRLQDKRQSLKHILQQRVNMAVRLRRSADSLPQQLPAWVKAYIDEMTFANDSNRQQFMQEFDRVYSSFLPQLHNRYPTLTEQDDQYIALALLGLDNTEIAVLLNQTDRTIWNRRQKIKTRLGDGKMDLDKWIEQNRFEKDR